MIHLQPWVQSATALAFIAGRGQKQIQPRKHLLLSALLRVQAEAGQHLTSFQHLLAAAHIGKRQHLLLTAEHIAGRVNADHPGAAAAQRLLHLDHLTAGDQQQLLLRLFPRQNALIGLRVGLAQDIFGGLAR